MISRTASAILYLAKKKNRCRSGFGYVLDASSSVPTRFSESRMSNKVSWIWFCRNATASRLRRRASSA